jgi:hypothetical protein
MCTVTGSTSTKPDYPVFVEWYWSQQAALVAEFYYSGKMTFVGTQKWLQNNFDAINGFQGPPGGQFEHGLPLLNTTNHTLL